MSLKAASRRGGTFHRLGVRMVGFAHNLRNQLAKELTDRKTGGVLRELKIQADEELDSLE